MTLSLNIKNAKEAADSVSYHRGKIIKPDFLSNIADVSVYGTEYLGLPVTYDCGDGKNGAYAFTINDDVLVRSFNSTPQCVAGFYGDLWPCVPMPSQTYIIGDKAYSKSMFQETEYIQSNLTLFQQRYTQIYKKSCAVTPALYVNQPQPDMTGRFVTLETDTYSPTARDVNVYYDGIKIYHTYNSDPLEVFNGTRSNYLGTYQNPKTGAGIMVYQINTFTDWRPQISGHVDFDFYLYSSTGVSVRLCGASCNVTGEVSPATGECVNSVSGFYCDDDATGNIFHCVMRIAEAATFSADKYSNGVNSGGLLRDVTLSVSVTDSGAINVINTYTTDSDGNITYPDGSKGQPSDIYYKKKF